MSNRILIVDDDDDFRSLLSDLYTQADYQVKAVSNPMDALNILSQESFSLCVTDQSMPELKGVDFIEKSREFKPNLPIIMVSAYLGDELTQKLQSMHVVVFHKPLNIMSLLRKTSELIKNASNPLPLQNSKPAEVSSHTDLPQTSPVAEQKFHSFALKSDASKRLKREIESIGSTLPNLVLVGDEGTHFRQICEDIEDQIEKKSHHFIYFENRKINVFDISKQIANQPSSVSLVLALTEAYSIGVAQKQALLKLFKKTGPFAGVTNPVKFIFCLNEDLDMQFAKGVIDEDFYLILGQKEIFIPRLNLCQEDIPDLANKTAAQLITAHAVDTTFGGFEADTSKLLCNTEWERNHESLQKVVASALKLAGGRAISRSILTQAIGNPSDLGDIMELSSVSLDKQTQHSKALEPIAAPSKTPPKRLDSLTPSSIPKISSAKNIPKIQSFPMLDDETELARSILKRSV